MRIGGPLDRKNRAPNMREDYRVTDNCSTSGETDASGDDIFCDRLGGGLSEGPVLWVA